MYMYHVLTKIWALLGSAEQILIFCGQNAEKVEFFVVKMLKRKTQVLSVGAALLL